MAHHINPRYFDIAAGRPFTPTPSFEESCALAFFGSLENRDAYCRGETIETPHGLISPAPVETRVFVCEFCGGDGSFSDDRPTATPNGPHYGPDVRCTACNGEGEYEAELFPITEDDLEDAA